MMATLKAEFRKLLTIRSTYLICSFALLLDVLFAFYLTGWRMSPEDLHSAGTLTSQITAAAGLLAMFTALVGVILLTQEYRYNTIMYTLTASKSRIKVLVAKIITISVFAVSFTLLVSALSPLLTLLAVHLHGQTLVAQSIPYASLLWQVVFYGWGFAMLGLLMASLIRVQVGAIAALFLLPGTVEQLLGLLLKNNQVYLPFSALTAVLSHGTVSHLRALAIVMAYIVVGWLVAGFLFVRRDAN
jgi:ABC-2 type transport system permease protein